MAVFWWLEPVSSQGMPTICWSSSQHDMRGVSAVAKLSVTATKTITKQLKILRAISIF
jgi:hypothetical protein